MLRTKSESRAREWARERNRAYGLSVLDGGWYAGTPEQLRAIGVADIKR